MLDYMPLFSIMQDDAESGPVESSWETVAPKTKAVPAASRKHALPQSEGSPSTPWQVPKALKEAPPSPATSPMQTSEDLATQRSALSSPPLHWSASAMLCVRTMA